MDNQKLSARLSALAEKATSRPWQSRDEMTTEGFVTLIGNVDGEYVEGAQHCTYETIAVFEDEFGERLNNVGANIRLVYELVNALPTIISALQEKDL